MSMNVYIRAERKVQVIKTGKEVKQTSTFHAWQTPTHVTREIVASPTPIEAYKNWVRETSHDYTENVYHEDDIWHEEPPIGTRVYNAGTDHINDLEQWIKECESEGYDIEVSEG